MVGIGMIGTAILCGCLFIAVVRYLGNKGGN